MSSMKMAIRTDGFAVTIADLGSAAAAFARLQADGSAAVAAASSVLSSCAGMAGDDPVVARWRERYDPLTAALWAAIGASERMLGDIAVRLTDTGNAYLAGEHAATPGVSRAPARLPPVGVRDGVSAAAPPPCTGPDGIPDFLAEYFPGGDPPRLRSAAAAWAALATELDDVGRAGDAAFRSLVDANSGATFSAMRTFWARQYVDCGTDPLFNAIALAARQLERSCGSLAELIERTRAAVLGVIGEASKSMEPLEPIAKALGPLTRGVTVVELFIGRTALAFDYLENYRDIYLAQLRRLVDDLWPEDQARLERLADPPPRPQRSAEPELVDVDEVLGVGLRGTTWDQVTSDHPTPDNIHLTPERVVHILDGDISGGGHAPGAAIPGKSEFPLSWSDARILANATSIARDPDLISEPNKWGRREVTGYRDGVEIVVVVDEDGLIVTAAPATGPGIFHNPPN